MNDFLGEEAMFDEQDRRLRLRVNENRALEVDATPVARTSPSSEIANDNAPSPINEGAPPQSPGLPGNTTNPPTPPPAPSSPTARASDRRPQVAPIRAQQLAAGDFDDLASLEAQAKQLESLARELDSRANALELRVRELE